MSSYQVSTSKFCWINCFTEGDTSDAMTILWGTARLSNANESVIHPLQWEPTRNRRRGDMATARLEDRDIAAVTAAFFLGLAPEMLTAVAAVLVLAVRFRTAVAAVFFATAVAAVF